MLRNGNVLWREKRERFRSDERGMLSTSSLLRGRKRPHQDDRSTFSLQGCVLDPGGKEWRIGKVLPLSSLFTTENLN